MMAELVVKRSAKEEKWEHIPLKENIEFWIGRQPHVNLKVPSGGVSGKHCCITLSTRHDESKEPSTLKATIEDKSTNGTWVNGVKIPSKSSQDLHDGDQISFAPSAVVSDTTPIVVFRLKPIPTTEQSKASNDDESKRKMEKTGEPKAKRARKPPATDLSAEEIENLRQSLTAVEAKNRELEQTITSGNIESTKYQAQIKKLQQDLQLEAKNREETEKMLNMHKQSRKEVESNQAANEERIGKQRQELAMLTNDLKTAKAESGKATEEMQQLKRERDELERERDTLKAELGSLQDENQKFMDKVTSLEDKFKSLKDSNAATLKEVEGLKKEVKAGAKALVESRAQLESSQAELESTRKKCELVNENLKRHEDAVTELRATLQEERKSLSSVTEEKDTLNIQLEESLSTIQSLEHKLKQTNVEWESTKQMLAQEQKEHKAAQITLQTEKRLHKIVSERAATGSELLKRLHAQYTGIADEVKELGRGISSAMTCLSSQEVDFAASVTQVATITNQPEVMSCTMTLPPSTIQQTPVMSKTQTLTEANGTKDMEKKVLDMGGTTATIPAENEDANNSAGAAIDAQREDQHAVRIGEEEVDDEATQVMSNEDTQPDQRNESLSSSAPSGDKQEGRRASKRRRQAAPPQSQFMSILGLDEESEED